MKHLRLLSTFVIMLVVALFGGMSLVNASAQTDLPNKVVSDDYKVVSYMEDFRILVKRTDGGKYTVYCLDMEATYAGGVTFTKTGEVDPGFAYILNNRPQTSDPDRDFYVTQMAVWYYEDLMNQNNFNLEVKVKEYILRHKDEAGVAKDIYDLYYGAKMYKLNEVNKDHLKVLNEMPIVFKIEGDYFLSSEIYLHTVEGDKIKYSFDNAPKGTQVVKSTNGIKVRVPVSALPENHKLDFKLNIEATFDKYSAYYYYNSPKYQRVLFQDAVVSEGKDKETVNMTVYNSKEYSVNISKTDITQKNEIAGATLELKDSTGALIEKWVSTNETHKVVLAPGEYSLTETIAPKGYKLSKTSIYFMIDKAGSLFAKNEKGEYKSVSKINMINELIDVVSFAKKDAKTDKYLAGAKLVIKDEKGNTVHEFTSNDSVYQYSLQPGAYTLSEIEAPAGYYKTKEVVYFTVAQDGTLQVKNNKGNYEDSAMVVLYNTPIEQSEIVVPSTGASATLMIAAGIALAIGGFYCVKKSIKEC